jgi:hypothetical protein
MHVSIFIQWVPFRVLIAENNVGDKKKIKSGSTVEVARLVLNTSAAKNENEVT